MESELKSSESMLVNKSAKRYQLGRLFNPRSIAVVGGRFAKLVIEQCEKMGYSGDIFPVSRNRNDILGRQCFEHIKQLPQPPDAAFVGVNRHQTIEVVEQLSAMGAGGAVCYASGFDEVGDGEISSSLIRAANRMPILGPNCYGFINYVHGALLWPDQHGGQTVENGVAIIMQSSNIAINLTMNKTALPLAYMITLGNQTMVGMSDVIMELTDDDSVTAIGLHIEGIDDIALFAEAVKKARIKNKPIVVINAGRTQMGAALTLTHTASLSSDSKVMEALFDKLGVAQVNSLSAFLQALVLLHVHGSLSGKSMVSLSCSGGEASLFSDAADSSQIVFKPFDKVDVDRIAPTVNKLVTVSNPFDYHTFDWADKEKLLRTFCAVMLSNHSLYALVIDFPRQDRCDIADWLITLDAWCEAAVETGSKTAVLSSLSECMPEPVAHRLIENKIVPLTGFEDALLAIEAAAKIGTDSPKPFSPISISSNVNEANVFGEVTSKRYLERFGIAIPRHVIVNVNDDIPSMIKTLHYPLVAKACSETLSHKTEAGGVKLNIKNEAELLFACRELASLTPEVLIEEMITEGVVEIIIGLNNDPVVGQYLLIGSGGVFTELIADVQILLFPIEEAQIIQALSKLKIMKLLDGFRGKAVISKAGLIETLLKIQDIAQCENVVEMDINPLLLRTDGTVVAVDALIKLKS